MTYRQSNSSFKDGYLRNQSRLSQQIRSDSKDEGCPVIEESGTVCGETNSLSIFQEFRQMYDDCLQNLEGSENGTATLRKLAPFKKLIDDLWEQNAMLVETVEELEQEATYRVTNLQDRLNKSCQKICDYQDDVNTLIGVIKNYCKYGSLDLTGCNFKTFSSTSIFKNCYSCPEMNKGESQVSYERISSCRNICQCDSTIYEENKLVKSDFFGGERGSKRKSSSLKNTSLSGCSISEGKRGIKCDSFGAAPLKTNSHNATSWNKMEGPSKFISPKSCLLLCNSETGAVKNSDNNKKCDDLCGEFGGQECMGAININLNISNKESFTDCCCDCCCNETQAIDC